MSNRFRFQFHKATNCAARGKMQSFLRDYYRPQGKVMFSQASVSPVHNQPHGYSVTAHPCYGAVGTHPTGMLSC